MLILNDKQRRMNMAKKRLQKKKAAARAEAERIKSTSNAPQTSTLKIETEKTEPIKVETSKTDTS